MIGPRNPTVVAIASLLALAVLTLGLARHGRETSGSRPLIVFCAESTRPAMETIAEEYKATTGQGVELRFGASEAMLTQAAMVDPSAPGDLFLPADASYIADARARQLVAEEFAIAEMRGVVLLAPGNPQKISAWQDLLREGTRVALANPGAAIGRVTRDHLARTGNWLPLQPHLIETGNVSQSAAAAKVGSVDAAIVWDAVASRYPGQEILFLPELEGVRSQVVIAILRQSPDPSAAREFAVFVADPKRGGMQFHHAGFRRFERSKPAPVKPSSSALPSAGERAVSPATHRFP